MHRQLKKTYTGWKKKSYRKFCLILNLAHGKYRLVRCHDNSDNWDKANIVWCRGSQATWWMSASMDVEIQDQSPTIVDCMIKHTSFIIIWSCWT